MAKVSFSMSEESLQSLDELQTDFGPFVENRSETIRLVIRIFRKLVRTDGMLRLMLDHLQVTLRSNSEQAEFHFPPMRTGGEGAGLSGRPESDRRLRVIAFSRLAATFHGHVAETAYTSPSSLRRSSSAWRVA